MSLYQCTQTLVKHWQTPCNVQAICSQPQREKSLSVTPMSYLVHTFLSKTHATPASDLPASLHAYHVPCKCVACQLSVSAPSLQAYCRCSTFSSRALFCAVLRGIGIMLTCWGALCLLSGLAIIHVTMQRSISSTQKCQCHSPDLNFFIFFFGFPFWQCHVTQVVSKHHSVFAMYS